ncbi:MAG TPA: Gfo/Idh/MocA family oxidoreductase, partial [Candidatus Hydrogenedentes bacterium]|nr:Gfo/Idh/MocA family oxidoreductase [Candidatus Hydrogenedentota bacterium]
TTLAAGSRAENSGANDRIRLGFIGTGNRGGQLLDAFMQHSDMEITAICDVYKPHIEKAKAKIGGDVEVHADFRNLIGSNNVDAVVIATPDHWHAIQCIAACDAGKDVYVEKPLSVTIHEGRRMVEAARRNKRIVQVGTHRRSSPVYAKLAKLVQDGNMGHVTVSRAYHLSNMYPNGIGRAKPSEPPVDLDWDMWLGPRAMRPYQDNICPYKFRWWNDFSSQIANNGIHYLDAIRWITGELAPTSVCAMGGHFIVDDDRTIPDTMEATFQFASGRIAVFGQYEASGGPMIRKGEVEIRGTQGTACISGTSFEIFPEKGGQFQSPELRMESIKENAAGSNADLTAMHARNFLDCVRSREEPKADVEIGHRSTTLSLLGNISLATGLRLEWDAEAERITNDRAANDLLHYDYRKPWTLG